MTGQALNLKHRFYQFLRERTILDNRAIEDITNMINNYCDYDEMYKAMIYYILPGPAKHLLNDWFKRYCRG